MSSCLHLQSALWHRHSTVLEPIRSIFIGQTHSFSMDEDMVQYTTKLYKLLTL